MNRSAISLALLLAISPVPTYAEEGNPTSPSIPESGPTRPSRGIARVDVGAFDGSITKDVQCGTQRNDCKVTFGANALEISDGSKIHYSTIVDLQGSALAQVAECAKELPTLPYTQQGKGFPCWAGRPAWYVLIAHKEPNDSVSLSVFSFKNERTFKEFLINTFATRFLQPESAFISQPQNSDSTERK